MGAIGLLTAILIIGVIIFIHEFGHYIVCKLSGCSVSEFSLGWGPKLLSFKRRETEYRFSCLPLIGGYVKMAGGEGENAQLTQRESQDIKKYKLKTFEELRTWQKFSVFAGGVTLQAIVCILILTMVICIMGNPVTKVFVGGISDASPAEIAGLAKGDIVLEANGEKIGSAEQLIDFTAKRANEVIVLKVDREKEIKIFNVTPRYSKEQGRALMGINIAPVLYFEKENMKWYDYAFGGSVFTVKLSIQIVQGIWKLITSQVSFKDSVMGPVKMVAFTKEIVKTGFIQILFFFAMININLAIINLLPFPALDGGHLLFLSIEKITRIRIKPKVKEVVNMIGFALLIMLMLYVTYNDVRWLFKSRRSGTERNQPAESVLEK